LEASEDRKGVIWTDLGALQMGRAEQLINLRIYSKGEPDESQQYNNQV